MTLPASMKVHPIFHVFLLEPYKESNISGRTQPPPLCVETDNHEEYKVEEVLDSRQGKANLNILFISVAMTSRVVLSDVLGGKDVVEGRDGRTDGRFCLLGIGRNGQIL
jgi:hypothetical protein